MLPSGREQRQHTVKLVVSAPVNQLQLNLHQAAYTGQGSKFPLIRQNFPIIDNHHAHFRGKREFVLNLHIQKLADQSTKHIFYRYTYYDVVTSTRSHV